MQPPRWSAHWSAFACATALLVSASALLVEAGYADEPSRTSPLLRAAQDYAAAPATSASGKAAYAKGRLIVKFKSAPSATLNVLSRTIQDNPALGYRIVSVAAGRRFSSNSTMKSPNCSSSTSVTVSEPPDEPVMMRPPSLMVKV